ncbi:MAG: hypothetical protein MJ130_04390 [Lachnospiraceae bacterium]|nr:hypothetical protein [Lachnospiraceae bacterium]
MESRGFRTANAEENEHIIQKVESYARERIVTSAVFLVIAYVLLFGLYLGAFRFLIAGVENAKESYEMAHSENPLEGFPETEESIIEELYGGRTAYADSKTWHTEVNFIDKEASAATGTIVYDEAAFQEYYDSFLEEYDAMIDHDKVARELERRQTIYIESQKYDAKVVRGQRYSNVIEGIKSPQNIGMILGVLFMMFAACLPIIFSVKRRNKIRKGEYLITEAKLVGKTVYGRWEFRFIKTTAVVRYFAGETLVFMSKGQSLSLSPGDDIYLIDTGIPSIFRYRRYMLCKR